MAPKNKKRTAAAKFVDPIKSRTKLVEQALEEVKDLEERVQVMLCETLSVTIGQQKATRHPFNDRLVGMIGEVLDGHHQALQKTSAEKQSTFDGLTPTKGTREAALESAQAQVSDKSTAFEQAKQATVENLAKVKHAAAELENKTQEQAAGDEELSATIAKKDALLGVQNESLQPLLDGSVVADADRSLKIAAVVEAGGAYGFDASLMQAVVQVLEKDSSERTGFDDTCTEQMQQSFAGALQQFDDQLAAGAPEKAVRLAAVEQAVAAKQAAEARQEELVQQQAAAKEAKEAAVEEGKIAKKNLQDFMPDLKAAGDALDEAKQDLDDFTSGALAAYAELKEWKEGDFAPPPVSTGASYYESIDGMSCDRGIIDACRTAVAGQGDGRVSVEDPKQVFEKVADGGKETQKERWTLRYCMQAFKWTEGAHDWIVEELKKVPQEGLQGSPSKKARTEGGGYYEVIDGYKCDRGIVDACHDSVLGQGDGRISRDDAEKVWAKAKDGTKVSDAEKWTLRYCFANFNWTRAGHDWLLEQLQQEA